MAQLVLAGQGGAFGQGVGQRAEFEGFEQCGAGRRRPGRRAGRVVGWCASGHQVGSWSVWSGLGTAVDAVLGWCEFGGVAGEPGRLWHRRRRAVPVVVVSVARSSIEAILRDGDDIEVQRQCAGGLDRLGAVAADQAVQPVDGAHPGPGQRVVEDALGVDPDVGAVRGAGGDQRGQVPHRVTGLVFGQVARVGAAAARRLAGMDFHQLAAVVELHQLAVGAGVQLGADPAARAASTALWRPRRGSRGAPSPF